MTGRKLPKGVVVSIVATIILVAGLIYIYYLHPLIAVGPSQPIPFSHKLHVGVKQLDCAFCHNTTEKGRNAGLPSVDKCLYCHEHIIPNHYEIKRLHEYAENGQPIPWAKVTYLPDHVFFSHQRHVKAGVACEDCHGAIEKMDRIREIMRNPTEDLMGYQSQFTMGFCLDCHQQPVENNKKIVGHEMAKTNAELVVERHKEYSGTRAPVDCWTCHQ